VGPATEQARRPYVFRSACLSVCLTANVSQKPDVRTSLNLCASYRRPWLGPSLAALRWFLCTSGFVD